MAVERIEIDGVTMPLDGFCDVVNLWVLWQGPDTRGKDRPIPKGTTRPYPRRATDSKRTLECFVYGTKDETGAPHADVRAGLEHNWWYLRENAFDPTNIGDGTRTLTLHLPSGATKSGLVHVEASEPVGAGPAALAVTVDLTILGGALT